MCFKALSKKGEEREETQLMQGLFWLNPHNNVRESSGQGQHMARAIISNQLLHSLWASLPRQSLSFSWAFQQSLLASTPLPSSCWEQKPLCSLMLSYPFAPKQRSLSWISTKHSRFPPPVLAPWHSDYGAYKHSIASSAPPFGLTFQNLLLKRELSIGCGALNTAGLWPTTGTT